MSRRKIPRAVSLQALQIAARRNLAPSQSLTRQLDLGRWPYLAPEERTRANLAALPPRARRAVLRADPVCVWCRTAPSTTVDHVVPRVRGGTNSLLNLVGSCVGCNETKAAFLPCELGWTLRLPRRAFAFANPEGITTFLEQGQHAPKRMPRASTPAAGPCKCGCNGRQYRYTPPVRDSQRSALVDGPGFHSP